MDQTAKSRGVAQELLRLEAHRTLLTQMLRVAISQHEPSVRLNLLFASVLKVWRMGGAVQLLTGEAFVEEIQSLSRTMAEVTINAAYLQHAEDEEIDRFHHFDTQSMFKHATRSASTHNSDSECRGTQQNPNSSRECSIAHRSKGQ